MKFSESSQSSNEFIHSWCLLLMSLWTLLYLLFSKAINSNIAIVLMILGFYSKNGLSIKDLLKIAIYAFFFSSMFLLLNLLYPAKSLKTGEILVIYSINIYRNALTNGLGNFMRIFMLSLVSMSSTYAIVYSKVILYLMSNRKLKVSLGYPLLIALNSILLFKKEFMRIRLAAKLRGLSRWNQVFILFPLLVFAIRHSQRGALSLITRGLNPNKTLYFKYETTLGDLRWIFAFVLISIIISIGPG